MSCPDCKDGFYYPLIGPPENCQTCSPLGEKPQTDWSEYIPKSLTESKMRHMGLVFKEYPTRLLIDDTPRSMVRVIVKSFLEHTPITEIATILMKAEGIITIGKITGLANKAISRREARCKSNRGEP